MKYGTVERALASMYGADKVVETTFRARLKNMSRFGIPFGCNTGKGSKAEYSMNEVYQLIFALELAETGMLPITIDNTLRAWWERLLEDGGIKANCDASDQDTVLQVISPSVMSSKWTGGEEAILGWDKPRLHLFSRRVIIIPIGFRIHEFKALVPDYEEKKPIVVPQRKKGYPEAGVLSL